MTNWFLILGLCISISLFIYFCLKVCYEKFQKNLDYSKKGKVQYVRKTHANTYKKKYKSKEGYEAEKYSYIRLKNNKHFPSLLNFNDRTHTLELENGGEAVTRRTFIPNLNLQLKEISDCLKQNNIQHRDIIWHNFVIKDNILKLIDFEWAKDLADPPQWKAVRKAVVRGCKTVPLPVPKETNLNDFLLENGCGEEVFTEIHVILLWKTNSKKRRETQNIISTFPSLKILKIKDITLPNNQRINISSAGKKTAHHPFTIFVLKDTFPKYVIRQTHAATQLVNEHMYNLKTDVRGTYSNYKVCHGSFNTEETRDVLREVNLLQYWSKNRPVFDSLSDLFVELNKTNIQYVVERSFENKNFKKLLDTSKGDIDVITDDYYKFKGIVGGMNTHKYRKEQDNGGKIQNRVNIGGKEVRIDIRYVGDRYYPTQWMKVILQNKIKESNKFGTFYVPSKDDQVWMLYYHMHVHKRSPSQRNKTLKQLTKLAKELGLKSTKKSFRQFMKNKKYKIEIPEDPDVPVNQDWID